MVLISPLSGMTTVAAALESGAPLETGAGTEDDCSVDVLAGFSTACCFLHPTAKNTIKSALSSPHRQCLQNNGPALERRGRPLHVLASIMLNVFIGPVPAG